MAIRPPARARARLRQPRALVALVLVVVLLPAPAAAAPAEPLLRAPVEGPVIDPFRAPTSPWGSGNRGLEYATPPGTSVRAAADGEVVFADAVAGDRFVTVLHPTGLRSTVGPLADLSVVAGQRVRTGEVLGSSRSSVHLSVRAGDEYLDPAPLLAGARPPARLVLHDLFAGDGAAARRAERAFAAELQRELASTSPLEVLTSLLPSRAAFDGLAAALSPAAHLRRIALGLWAWHLRRGECTAADVVPAPPPQRRVAVLVAGFLSTSESAGIDQLDVAALGYDPGDVVRFSYEGGRVPGPVASDLGVVPATSYDAAATQRDLPTAGRELLRLLRALSAAAPGVPIDIYAHSQGGIVTRLALSELALPEEVDLAVTIASPHGGTEAATALEVLRDVPGVDAVLTATGPIAGVDAIGGSAVDMAEGSERLASLQPPPPSVRFLAIGARGDWIVPAAHTGVQGHPHVVVPTSGAHAHEAVVRAPETQRELALALAGLPPTCEPLLDAVGDVLVGELVLSIEDLAVGTLASAGGRMGLVASAVGVVLDAGAAELRPAP